MYNAQFGCLNCCGSHAFNRYPYSLHNSEKYIVRDVLVRGFKGDSHLVMLATITVTIHV